jgi:hypothetical protein
VHLNGRPKAPYLYKRDINTNAAIGSPVARQRIGGALKPSKLPGINTIHGGPTPT